MFQEQNQEKKNVLEEEGIMEERKQLQSQSGSEIFNELVNRKT